MDFKILAIALIPALSLFTLCQAYEFYYDRPGIFNRDVMNTVINSLYTFIYATYLPGHAYARGNVIYTRVTTAIGTFVVRLLLLSARGDPGFCALNPDPNDQEEGSYVAYRFRLLAGFSVANMLQYCSAAATCREGLFMIDYHLEDGSSHGSMLPFPSKNTSNYAVSALNVTIKARIKGEECDVFSSTMQSGYKGMPDSFLWYGSSLHSPNQRIALKVMPNCYIALVIVQPNIQFWRSNNADRYGISCVMRLQQDGNLVLYTVDGDNPVWATNIFCPGCAAPSYASLQDDCNFVVYRSQTTAVPPLPAWASETEHCTILK